MGREFERANLQKFKCPGGDVEVSRIIWKLQVTLPPCKEALAPTVITMMLISIILNAAYCLHKLKYLFTAFLLAPRPLSRLPRGGSRHFPVKQKGNKLQRGLFEQSTTLNVTLFILLSKENQQFIATNLQKLRKLTK